MAQKKQRVHDWHKLKWPFTVTFLYYSLISLFTGVSDLGEEGFISVFLTVLVLDAVAYFSYCSFLSKNEEDIRRLWFVFIMTYVFATTEQLGVVWDWLSSYAAARM